MKEVVNVKLLVAFFSLYFIPIYPAQETLNNWLCTYLDPEIVHRINEKEVKTIVEIGSCNGLNAIHLNRHYKCLTFVFENNAKYLSVINKNISPYAQIIAVPQSDTVHLGNWMDEANIACIDLLCINLTGACLSFLQNAETYLDTIKYILINNDPSLRESKEYLKSKGFRVYFDGVSLFKHQLFVHESIDNFKIDIQFLKDFNTPVLSPLLPGNDESQLIYEAVKDNHKAFHTIATSHTITTTKTLNINYQDANGNTALMVAVAHDSQYPLKKLLQNPDIDFTLRNKNGCTALIIAAALSRAYMAQLLLDDPRGMATVNMVNKARMSAEESARLVRAAEIADFIDAKKTRTVQNNFTEDAEKIIPKRAMICGICKDVSQYLPDMMRICERMGTLFEDYKIVIYENDSTDGTQDILRKWMNTNEKVTVHCESLSQSELEHCIINKDENGEFNRIELIALARNKLLDAVMAPEYNSYPIIIMMDMDFTSAPPVESIIEVFESNREWDAVFGYGMSRQNVYWDWYAFRDFNEPFGPELLGHDWFGQKLWSLNKTDQWCPVYSAFGGIGIYKRASIEGCRYSALVTEDLEKLATQIIDQYTPINHPVVLNYLNDVKNLNSKEIIFTPHPYLSEIKEADTGILLHNDSDAVVWRMNSFAYHYPIVCEHVPFHASMIQKGKGKLFINPRLTLTYTR